MNLRSDLRGANLCVKRFLNSFSFPTILSQFEHLDCHPGIWPCVSHMVV